MELQIEDKQKDEIKNSPSKSSDLSDWDTVSHSELNDSLPAIASTRAKDQTNKTHLKHKKLIKQIALKVGNYVKVSFKEINYENVHFIIIMVMSELQKLGIKNTEKKQIAKLIVVYILDCYAFSHVINYYTVEILDGLIEMCYFQLFNKKKKSCLCC